MSRVLHVFDASVSPAALQQLALVRAARPRDELVRIGSTADRTDLPAADHALRESFGWNLTATPALRDLVNRRQATALHAWNLSSAELVAAASSPAWVSLYEMPGSAQLGALRQAVAGGADLLAPSEYLARHLAQAVGDKGRVRVVAPAAEKVDRRAGRSEARKALGLDDSHYVLLTVPQTYAGAGMRWCVWGMAVVRQIVPQIRLVLGGAGPAADRGMDFAQDIRFASETLAPGRSKALPTLLAAADAMLLCEDDGYGLSVLAMAVQARLPVIAANAGELGDVLRDGQTALLVRPRDPRAVSRAIWLLHSRPELAGRLAVAAAEQFEDVFAPARLHTELRSIYDEATVKAAR